MMKAKVLATTWKWWERALMVLGVIIWASLIGDLFTLVLKAF